MIRETFHSSRYARLLLLAVAVSAAAAVPKAWTRADGRPANPAQLEVDRTTCKDELRKAALADGGRASEIGLHTAAVDMFVSCMAVRGYVALKGG